MASRAILGVDIGLYIATVNMAPVRVLIWDPCPFGLPEMTVAHIEADIGRDEEN